MAMLGGAVLKHSAAVQMSNEINFVQRRAWNILLANAYDDLPHKEEYSIDIRDLIQNLGISRTNSTNVVSVVKSLMSTVVTWDVLGKNSEDWDACQLLGPVRKRGTKLLYRFPGEVRTRLYNPRMYARISLSLQNQFKGKHTLALYELSEDYFMESKRYGQTPWIPILDIRRLLGFYNPEKKINETNRMWGQMDGGPLARWKGRNDTEA